MIGGLPNSPDNGGGYLPVYPPPDIPTPSPRDPGPTEIEPQNPDEAPAPTPTPKPSQPPKKDDPPAKKNPEPEKSEERNKPESPPPKTVSASVAAQPEGHTGVGIFAIITGLVMLGASGVLVFMYVSGQPAKKNGEKPDPANSPDQRPPDAAKPA